MKSLDEIYKEIDNIRSEIFFLTSKIVATYKTDELITYINTINERYNELKAYLQFAQIELENQEKKVKI
jgi:hypothetical protein